MYLLVELELVQLLPMTKFLPRRVSIKTLMFYSVELAMLLFPIVKSAVYKKFELFSSFKLKKYLLASILQLD